MTLASRLKRFGMRQAVSVLLATVAIMLLPLMALAKNGPTLFPTQAAFEHATHSLKPYVTRHADGTMDLRVSRLTQLLLGVSDAAVSAIEGGMGVMNKEIAAGVLGSDAALNVFPVDKDGNKVVMPYANEQDITTHWYGIQVAMNSTTTNRLIAILAMTSGVAAMISVLVNSIPGAGQIASAISGIIAGLAAIDAGWLTYLNAAGNGIYLYFTWMGCLMWGAGQS